MEMNYQHKNEDISKSGDKQKSSDLNYLQKQHSSHELKDTKVIEKKLDDEEDKSIEGDVIYPTSTSNKRRNSFFGETLSSNIVEASPETKIREYSRLKKEEAEKFLNSEEAKNFPPELARLCLTSYFSLNEVKLLYHEFKKYSNNELVMTKKQFVDNLTPFHGNDQLTKSLMRAIDKNGDEQIQFPEFIQALSIMCRGNKTERLRFTFEICDFNGDALVSREEVMQTIKTISKIFTKIGFNKDDRFGEPSQIIDSIFSGGLSPHGSYVHFRNELSLNDFIERSQQEVDLSHCFGMFDYFFSKFLYPLEQLDVAVEDSKLKGNLTKIKTTTFLNLNIAHHRIFSLKDGFLIIYKENKLKGGKKKATRVIFLPGSTAKVIEDLRRSTVARKYRNQFGFRLTAGAYSRFFLMENKKDAEDWVNAIRYNSRFGFRFQAFSKNRDHIKSEWFINGAEYYATLAKCLREAKYEIFITGWWVHPYVCLERDPSDEARQLKSRLDNILTERARQGVKIYILIWNETNIGVKLGSGHAKKWLESCHPNINVVRHPNIYPLSWSHHQKSVVIDQKVAFIGGIDICFMRYETHRFQILDLSGRSFIGKDYGNLMTECVRTGDPYKDQLDRTKMPRMPWHDVHVKLEGLSARDTGHNFIQRWNHAVLETGSKKSLLVPKYYDTERDTQEYKPKKVKNLIGDFKRGLGHISYGREISSHKNNRGIDNPVVRRMAQSQAKNFKDSEGFKITKSPTLTQTEDYHPEDEDQFEEFEEFVDDNTLKIPDQQNTSTTTSSPMGKYHLFGNISDDCSVQVVRSGSKWSIGCEVEDSCYKAYLHFIRWAKHFIYIQNLFFISSCGAKIPKNRIALAILNRIRKAIKEKQVFKVSVLVSINPSGDVNEAANRMVIAWTNKTMFEGPDSIIGILSQEFPDVDLTEYIGFFSLRQWEISNDKIFTEQIYVHSKVLIVDDRVAVIGSCNINDRSMLGSRDSELACVIQDQEKIPITMNGKSFNVGKFSHTLRVNLWRIHLGLKDSDIPNIVDPLNAFKDYWLATAVSNTKIYKEVFGETIPENQPRIGMPQERCIPVTDGKAELINKVRGVLILYPRKMYFESNLLSENVNILTPEYYVDASVFT